VSGNSFPTGLAAGVKLTGVATGMTTIVPLPQAAGTVVSTYVVEDLSVATGATLTIAAGVTFIGTGLGSLTVSGTLNAVGTSTATRDVAFNNVGLIFDPTSNGTLRFCTIHSTTLPNPVLLQGAQMVTGCTIGNDSGYGVYVQSGTPTISDNDITASDTGIHYEGGGGTASGNMIGFSGNGTGRYGIFVSGSAMPILSGNTILDYTPVSTGIEVRPGAGNAMTQILNNIICAIDEGKSFIDVPDNAGVTVSGNVNQCGAPTRTPTLTPIAAATRTATMTMTVTPTPAVTATPSHTATVAPTNTVTVSPTGATTPTATPTGETTETPTPTATATVEPIQCGGDCDGNHEVTVDELIKEVNIALGNADVSTCLPSDANGDGAITIDEIISGVNDALNGCA
jgi:hypothetical protein